MARGRAYPRDAPYNAGVTDKEPIINVRAEEERSRSVLLKVVRVAFIVIFFTVVLLDILSYNRVDSFRNARVFAWPITISISVGLALVVVFADILTPRKKVSTLFSILLGLLGAMIATLAVGQVLDLFWAGWGIEDRSLISLLKVLIGIGLAYLAVATVLQTQDDFRLVIPYVEFVKQIRGPRPMILDTSALIDGRVHDLALTGLISAPIVVPRFVVEELQALADSTDRLKRGRGRRGLAMIEKLQTAAAVDVMIDDTNLTRMPVDQMLLDLARTMPGIIITTDSGLARVADIQKIAVLNLHDVASAMRPQVVAGESLRLRVLRPGEHPGQAVGYLDDGTMVVVDHADTLIGQDVDAVVTSTLQTNAGRMIFAKAPTTNPTTTPPAPAAPHADGPPPLTPIPAELESAEPDEPDPDEAAQPDEPANPATPTATPTTPTAIKPGPFPVKPPRSIRNGSPRNPRR